MALSKIALLTTSILLCCIFVVLRWYRIDETLFFQNDMGRDFLVLYDWHATGKPPLLGPQNSVLPFNQSAFYFYFFYPIFVLSEHSLFSTNLTLLCMYLIGFLSGWYLLRNNKLLLLPYLLASFLVAIHPQTIFQHRYIWNPSFVPLFLFASYFFYNKLQKNFSKTNLLFFSLACALAVGMSVSAIPAVLAYLIVSVFIFKNQLYKVLQLLGTLVLAHCLVFLPFIIFELRYDFQITRRLMATSVTTLPAYSDQFSNKFIQLSQLVLPQFPLAGLLCAVGIGLLLLYSASKVWQFHSLSLDLQKNLVLQTGILYALTTIGIVLSPIRLESHYIFASLTFLLIFFAVLPRKIAVAATIICAFFWLQPAQLQSYFTPAPRSIETLRACFASYCAQHSEPLFVSVQSNYHSYHFGPEFRFLLKEHGCTVRNIESEPDAARRMAVVVDGGSYTHGITSYQELTTFGEANEVESTVCSPFVQIHTIEKK